MTRKQFKLIYDEVSKNGYYFSGQRSFINSFNFNKECERYGFTPINTLLLGHFYPNENADVYMIYDVDRFEHQEAKKIMDQKYNGITIGSVVDLIRAKDIMIETRGDVRITQISELEYTIKLDGGRFSDFDLNYINADIAKIILDYQTQYNAFIDGLEQKFSIQIPQSQRMLKFKLEKGCLEISADITNLLIEAVKNMQDWQTMTVLLVAICAFFANKSYHRYIDAQSEKIKLQAQQSRDEAEQRRLEIVSKMVKDLSSDRSLQAPANHIKKSVASVLQDDEKAFIAPQIEEQASQPLTSADKDKFRVVLPTEQELPNTEEEIDDFFHIDAQHFTPNKPFRLRELRLNVNSDVIDARKRMAIIRKADKQEPVRLKIKLIKNTTTGDIEQAYILDVLD